MWLLSYFAMPSPPVVEGRDITPIEPVARVAQTLGEAEEKLNEKGMKSAEKPAKGAEPKKKGEKRGKGDGKRKSLTSGLFAS